MNSVLQNGRDILKEDGLKEFTLRSINFIYSRTISPLLPRRTIQYNGVDVPAIQLFDKVLPWRNSRNRPNYESGLVSGIEQHIEAGMDVIIVGGGWGVTAVEAARQVGEQGSVTVYEGAEKEVRQVRNTAELNGCSDIVDVRHAIVGSGLNLRGDRGDANLIPPEELPRCDVLELDCEGAEIGILQNLSYSPPTILLETHGIYDASTERVQDLLESLQYSVISNVIADKDLLDKCIENDIRVLTAVQE